MVTPSLLHEDEARRGRRWRLIAPLIFNKIGKLTTRSVYSFLKISNIVWNPETQLNHDWWCHNHKPLLNCSHIMFELCRVNDTILGSPGRHQLPGSKIYCWIWVTSHTTGCWIPGNHYWSTWLDLRFITSTDNKLSPPIGSKHPSESGTIATFWGEKG